MADMRLIDAPVGLFYHGKTLCVKTEYFTDGGVDAYIVSSGEYFHGGTQTSEERNNLMVRPVNQRNLFGCRCLHRRRTDHAEST